MKLGRFIWILVLCQNIFSTIGIVGLVAECGERYHSRDRMIKGFKLPIGPTVCDEQLSVVVTEKIILWYPGHHSGVAGQVARYTVRIRPHYPLKDLLESFQYLVVHELRKVGVQGSHGYNNRPLHKLLQIFIQ